MLAKNTISSSASSPSRVLLRQTLRQGAVLSRINGVSRAHVVGRGLNNTVRLYTSSAPSSSPFTFFQKKDRPTNTVVKFVPQQEAWVVERMGKFHRYVILYFKKKCHWVIQVEIDELAIMNCCF